MFPMWVDLDHMDEDNGAELYGLVAELHDRGGGRSWGMATVGVADGKNRKKKKGAAGQRMQRKGNIVLIKGWRVLRRDDPPEMMARTEEATTMIEGDKWTTVEVGDGS